MPKTLYLVVEHFKNKDSTSVYRRLRDKGRMAPEGLLYVSSWVDSRLEICYQLMETAEPTLFDKWITNWTDLIDFEVYPLRNFSESLTALKVCVVRHSPIWVMTRMCRRVL